MKRLWILLVFVTATTWAQSPFKMSYQAVIRDADNILVSEKEIGMQISILQGSINGTVVYSEIFSPNPLTNINGLVTVEIGGGIPVSGSFSSINWFDGPYYIKTQTDPAGGTNYTIAGTSQMLSVPYALHAKTVESYTETDPLFVASPASGITNTSISNWNTAYNWGNHAIAGYVPGLRKLTINGNTFDLTTDRTWDVGTVTLLNTHNGIEGGPVTSTGTIGLTGQALALHNLNTTGLIVRTENGVITSRTIEAGSGISVTNGDGINGNPVISLKTWKIGDFAHGGIVFWVDETGQHGLVCAKEDQEPARWYAGTYGNTRAYADGPFSGRLNTVIIIAAHVAIGDDGETYAARICNEHQETVNGRNYGDWYLPSYEELYLMYLNKEVIESTALANGGSAFINDIYWSSTENVNGTAYYQVFNENGFRGSGSKGGLGKVRAVRAF
jgi:hypothetical protein